MLRFAVVRRSFGRPGRRSPVALSALRSVLIIPAHTCSCGVVVEREDALRMLFRWRSVRCWLCQ
jgi:hypothetical protein